MLPIETTTKLLKLHLQWPDRRRYDGKEEQPLEFYKWLFVNHHERPEVMALDNLEMVDEFLKTNKHVLWPSRKEEEKWANLRLEPRIENDVEISLTVVESNAIDAIGTSLNGRTLDIGLHGMRVALAESLPDGSTVKLCVINDTQEYQLQAGVRWTTGLEQGHLVGLQLEESILDFATWRANFGADFVAPSVVNKTRASK